MQDRLDGPAARRRRTVVHLSGSELLICLLTVLGGGGGRRSRPLGWEAEFKIPPPALPPFTAETKTFKAKCAI